MNITMMVTMEPVTESELEQVDGGLETLTGMLFDAYRAKLAEIEAHPERHTWMMDWYYR